MMAELNARYHSLERPPEASSKLLPVLAVLSPFLFSVFVVAVMYLLTYFGFEETNFQ
jgi:hypothetical protein